jgi:molybdenum cofactor biosynthesis enzyme MoaA
VFSLRTKVNIARALVRKDRPFYIQYYIGSACNLVCRQCNIVEANSDLRNADLATIEKIAKNLRKIGAGVILLTGGEPFLRKDLPDIVRILAAEGLNPRLQTAGMTTTRAQMEACAEAGAKDINISLDSLLPAKQEYINGSIPKSWHRAIEAIVNANDVFDDPDRICATGTVLSKLNHMEVPAIAEFATFMGWYSSVVPVHITTPDNPMNFRGVADEMQFTLPDDEHLLSQLEARMIAERRAGLNIFDSEAYIRSMFYFLRNNSPNWRKDGVCDSPSLYFAILPNGDFAVCCDHRFQGRLSVADDRFPEIYRSNEFRDAVMPTVTACSGCNYGSYPEVTLSVRDPRAIGERIKTVLFSKRATVPKRSVAETYDFIEHLREKHRIPPYEGPDFQRKPMAFSQRYGEPEGVQRGRKTAPAGSSPKPSN